MSQENCRWQTVNGKLTSGLAPAFCFHRQACELHQHPPLLTFVAVYGVPGSHPASKNKVKVPGDFGDLFKKGTNAELRQTNVQGSRRDFWLTGTAITSILLRV